MYAVTQTDLSVIGTRGKDVTKLWVSPRNLPDWTFMAGTERRSVLPYPNGLIQLVTAPHPTSVATRL